MFGRKEVKKLVALSRLQLSDEEIEELAGEVNSVLAYVSEIQSVSVTEGKRTAGALRNVMREDKEPHEGGIYTGTLLDQVPQREGGYVKVKKIL